MDNCCQIIFDYSLEAQFQVPNFGFSCPSLNVLKGYDCLLGTNYGQEYAKLGTWNLVYNIDIV